MRCSLKRMLRTVGEKEPQGVVYQGVEDDMDDSKDSFKVVCEGNANELQSCLKKRKKLPKYDGVNASPLHYAAEEGDIGLMETIISDSSCDVLNVMDSDGNTPLHRATEKNQVESVRFLLSKGANPNLQNHSMMAPLHLAVQGMHNEVAQVLMEHSGTNVNLEGENGNTAVIIACAKDNSEALQMLLKNGAKPCKSNKLGCFPIHQAAFSGSKKCMEIILKFGEENGYDRVSHINFVNNGKASPLHMAVQSGDLSMIKMCLDNGAQVELMENGKCTALHFAATQGATEIVKLMISSYSGSNDIVNAVDGNHETPLHRASLFDHYELAEYLISVGADINSTDSEGRSPLLLATASASWNIVNLLLSKGAQVDIKDHLGRNFLHLTVQQPYGLRNVQPEFMQMQHIKELVMDEDNDGCTPLHYACRQGVPVSVNNLLGFNVSIHSKSKDKQSPLHFAASYGRINTCQRLLRDMSDTRLLNEGDLHGMTPLHLAAKNGHDKVVQLLLKKGALFLSDHSGWTALHHASLGGYTQTMKVILDTNLRCTTDQVDEDGNTALHLAAREGHAKAAAILLSYGADILLNRQQASFLHLAIHNKRKEVVLMTIRNRRWDECLRVFSHNSPSNRCPVMEMVEYLPECMKVLLDCCMTPSTEDKSCRDYHIEYNFRYLQCPLEFVGKNAQDVTYEPLPIINTMVHHNRIELLNHPVCKEYLLMKWLAYGFRAHLMNLGSYCLGLLPMTFLVVNIKPGMAFNSTGIINETSDRLEILDTKDSYSIKVCMILVFLSSLFGYCKELVQIFQQKRNYLLDHNNGTEWVIYTTSIIFVLPLFISIPAHVQWQCGAIAIYCYWMNFLLYLQRFENCGIFIVMLEVIMKTLLRSTVVFIFLLLAFGLSFYVLLSIQDAFSTPVLSIIQTFSMMLGDINYRDAFLEPFLRNELAYPLLSFIQLITFTMFVPIVLMNLLIGLAVGDIAEVQKHALLKRIAMQVELHTNLEKKLPLWFLRQVDQKSIVVYPNRARYGRGLLCIFHQIFCTQEVRQEIPNADTALEVEIMKQKYRLKDVTSLLEKQHELIKLIIQKMEIISETEDEDNHSSFQDRYKREQMEQRNSKWNSVLKAVRARTQNP
ncbi:transient receptor potential cation channel subfamily A member 1 [Pipistrellus kuhlii]|uniref:Transient receptor potential cation channel subfamily A member 1 n=1 Tax=Pipistrellus kuhlii TaxID=59472 RepID=A0A7J7VP98_PIPKU|nr:transient receptor potential cation channel subfamily A member 1 [Pipistrellus kuhlii]KAF6326790.1 transient receptor potential cation channel subfamily A member 1 [Pipistrellus kuhlii]